MSIINVIPVIPELTLIITVINVSVQGNSHATVYTTVHENAHLQVNSSQVQVHCNLHHTVYITAHDKVYTHEN